MNQSALVRGSSPVLNSNLSTASLQISSLPVNVNVITSFLHIHLKDEFQKLAYSKSEYIRYRQIIQHAELILVDGSAKHQYLLDLLKKVWMQTIIGSCFKDFEDEYLTAPEANIKELKKTVAERYLFQLCKLREFVESGRRNFAGKELEKQVNLSAIFGLSDENLYEVLKKKNTLFLSKASDANFDYSKCLESFTKYKYDVLKSFKPQSLDYDVFLNKDYIFQDIRFLLNLAIDQWNNFQTDMANIFQGRLETNLKVKRESSGGFNVIGVRRILTKWVEILLQNDKELASSSRFYNFITRKESVFDNFYMNDKDSRVPPCQQKLCHLLLELLICSVYHGDKRNPEFGLFIYDLLRGKMSVQTMAEAQELFQKLSNPPPNLQNKIEIFRVKNRLKTHNRDVIVNFRYGNILAAEIQIGLAHLGSYSEKINHKKMYEYKHFIYELSRSIFGPTIELMNIYEDFYRQKEIQMYSTGMVSLRDTKRFEGIDFTDKECLVGHKLIFIRASVEKKRELCRRCFQEPLDHFHCFRCTVSFCGKCVDEMAKRRMNPGQGREMELKMIHQIQQLYNLQGFNLVIFHLEYSPASCLMLKYISNMVDLKKNNENIYKVDVLEDPRIVYYIKKYLHIERFPAFVLFHDSDLFKCIVGASLYKVVDLIDLLQIQTPSKKCPLGHELVAKKPAAYVFWTCNECYKVRNKSEEQIFYCTECLYCCCSLCGFCKNDIEYFEDKNGTSYLSSAIIPEKALECSRRHKMQLHRSNPTKKSIYNCSSCNKDFFYIEEAGMYSCRLCKEYKCNFCTESGFSSVSNHSEYANHSVEPYLLTVPLCSGCNRPHKFSDHSKQGKEWMCRNCKNPFRECYHVSCEKCSRHYCGQCKLLIKSKDQMATIATQCSCKLGTLKPAKRKYNTLETFMCMICFNRYYYNEAHHQCEYCKFDYCNNCLETLKTKVKVHILSQDIQNRTTITEYMFQLPLTMTLSALRESLKSCSVITSTCLGRFKLPNKHEYLSADQEEMTIGSLGPSYQILYLKTVFLTEQLLNSFIARFINTSDGNPLQMPPSTVAQESFDGDEETSLVEFDDD